MGRVVVAAEARAAAHQHLRRVTRSASNGRCMSVITSLLVLWSVVCSLLIVPAPDASAHINKPQSMHGWTSGSWYQRRQAGQDITVNIRRQFPANKVVDGVLFSFTDRYFDSLRVWTTPSPHTLATLMSSIRLTQALTLVCTMKLEPDKGPTGSAYRSFLTPGYSVVHDARDTSFNHVDIYITPRADWYTGDNSTRARFESCDPREKPYSPPPTAYMCEREQDFASTMVHELGHALADILHPM